jgi:hypothetical protein
MSSSTGLSKSIKAEQVMAALAAHKMYCPLCDMMVMTNDYSLHVRLTEWRPLKTWYAADWQCLTCGHTSERLSGRGYDPD